MKRACLAVSLVLLASACSPQNAITVGSKNFTEQLILGEIAAQQIERKLHLPVRRRLGLGGTLLTHEALVKGEIDLYPEYTGTAASAVLKQKVVADPVAAYMQVKDAYRSRFHLNWLPPLGFNDTFAMVVRASDAKSLPVADLSHANSRAWRLGVGYEFLTRPDGLASLNSSYGMHWEGTPKTMDLGLLYQALRQRNVDIAAGNSTDAQLTDPALKQLLDDRKAFPSYMACIVIRQSLENSRPGVGEALTMLSPRINEDTMRSLNRRVDVDHRPVAQVAEEFLKNEP